VPDLDFQVDEASVTRYAAVPTLAFPVSIATRREDLPVRSIALQCQVRIDARKRVYSSAEQARLKDLFGEPGRWGETLHSLLWTHVHTNVPGFESRCTVDLAVPASFDFNVAATKYFAGLEDGAIPLTFLFSGTVFYRDIDGSLAMDLIDWRKEAAVSLPAATWRAMMEYYYPNQAWLTLNRRVFDALTDYKQRHGYAGYDEALTSLMDRTRRAAS